MFQVLSLGRFWQPAFAVFIITEKAAKLLGIGERTLYRKIKEYGIQ